MAAQETQHCASELAEAGMSESESGAPPERKRRPIGSGLIYIVCAILGWVAYPVGATLFGKPWPYIAIAMLVAIFAWVGCDDRAASDRIPKLGRFAVRRAQTTTQSGRERLWRKRPEWCATRRPDFRRYLSPILFLAS